MGRSYNRQNLNDMKDCLNKQIKTLEIFDIPDISKFVSDKKSDFLEIRIDSIKQRLNHILDLYYRVQELSE